jgi:hypothetical protein
LADDIQLTIGTGIVNNCADKWKCGLLHREAIHGILDIGCLVESDTPRADHPFILFFFHAVSPFYPFTFLPFSDMAQT